MLDFHNHIIPGVDDGSASLEESLAALKMMWEQGITHVITTPHLRASVLKKPAEFEIEMGRIDDSWRKLVDAVKRCLPQIKLDRGVELALDDPDPPVADERVRLAGTRFVLVEFPYFTVPPNSALVLGRLKANGATPIVAHPERYGNLRDDLALLGQWKECGAFLQLNAGSLVGAYGDRIEARSWHVVEAGLADYVSSDYHARGDCLTASARDRMSARNGDFQFRMLSSLNGDKLIAGKDPAPVGALPRSEPKWYKLRNLLRRRK